ncbi:MAG: DUF2071 domain-containing protein, partial [Planctomycetales bacterium]|nr:DUF2071 domain-containing protein [Planctomycetales bacterium]
MASQERAVRYSSQRVDGEAEFQGRYGPEGAPQRAIPGSLEHFLTERYCLYSSDFRGRLYRADVHHVPWPLQSAWAEIDINTMSSPIDVALQGKPLLHYAERIDVASWPLERVPAAEHGPIAAPCVG